MRYLAPVTFGLPSSKSEVLPSEVNPRTSDGSSPNMSLDDKLISATSAIPPIPTVSQVTPAQGASCSVPHGKVCSPHPVRFIQSVPLVLKKSVLREYTCVISVFEAVPFVGSKFGKLLVSACNALN